MAALVDASALARPGPMGLQRAGTQAAGALIGGVGLLVWNALVTGDAVGLSIDRKTLLSADTRSCSAGPGIGVFVWRAPPPTRAHIEPR